MPKAIGMVEFSSIARGIYAADQMVKVSDVDIVTAGSTCPGKFIVIVHGDVAAVDNSVDTGEQIAGEHLVDTLLIPNVSPQIFPAITGTVMPDEILAIGIIESFSQATMVTVADAVLKTAMLEPIELRLGNGLGGKSYFIFTGDVAAVKAGVEAGEEVGKESGLLVNTEIIPSPSNILVDTLL
ncbi:microcompartment protein CcmL/EutN [Acetoanaerobium pronyense]|uniref:Microcompartment protein CcmL/EutN n=1 Tax=Acetoanaerobium pronyense TaxID=1482736 RepID=A0ABS4KIX8_9FIRM|nr:BMC domain-containing protein [Acetoanaerobium pronyense]MBP2027091.1 microcompartment protein CcmL/EutN [Acetoanaerobium pronyense]